MNYGYLIEYLTNETCWFLWADECFV